MSSYPVAYRKGVGTRVVSFVDDRNARRSIQNRPRSRTPYRKPRLPQYRPPGPVDPRSLAHPDKQRELAIRFLKAYPKAIGFVRHPIAKVASAILNQVMIEGFAKQPDQTVTVQIPPLHEDPNWTLYGWYEFAIHSSPTATFHHYRQNAGIAVSLHDNPPWPATSSDWTADDWADPMQRPNVTLVSVDTQNLPFIGPFTGQTTEVTALFNGPMEDYSNPTIEIIPGKRFTIGVGVPLPGFAEYLQAQRELLNENVETMPASQLNQMPVNARKNLLALAIGAEPFAPTMHRSARHVQRATREKKFKFQRVELFRWVMESFGMITEGIDLLDALWGALPESARSGYYQLHKRDGSTFYKWRHDVSVTQKALDLWDNLDQFDISQAVVNVVSNQLEDALIGKLGSAQQKLAKEHLESQGRPGGLGFGPAI